jgi:hypothetical protein
MNQPQQEGARPQILDLTPNFLGFWEEAKDRSREAQEELWYDRYEKPFREIFALTGGRHGNAAHLPTALARFPAIVPALPGVAASVRPVIEELIPALCGLFELPALELRWVLLVGMFWADGWVGELDGIPTCFISVEHLVHATPARAKLLLGHEAAHVAHAACLGREWDALSTIGHQLFLEGLAIAASARLVPGLAPAMYSWLGLTQTVRGQDLDAWTAQCETAWVHERAHLSQQLSSNDQATFARYFLQAPPDFPERMGYWAGWHLVADLLRQYPFAELARWTPRQIDALIRTSSIRS